MIPNPVLKRDVEMSCDTSNIESTPSTNKESITHNPKETFVSEYTKWHIVGDKNKKREKHKGQLQFPIMKMYLQQTDMKY